jgi:hypothetical protein
MPAKKSSDRLLDAISSLKRAAHIEHDAWTEKDALKGDQCHIYTGSEESLNILHNLIVQAFEIGKPKVPKEIIADVEDYNHDGLEIFRVSFTASQNTRDLLAEKIEQMTAKLIAPDSPGKRKSR